MLNGGFKMYDSENDLIVINGIIKFQINDTARKRLIELLLEVGSLVMDCPNCSTTVIPQSKAAYAADLENEQRINCVGCNKSMVVLMYPGYGFVVLDSVK